MGHYVLGTVPSALPTLSPPPAITVIEQNGLLLTSVNNNEGRGAWRWLNDLLKGTELAHNTVESSSLNRDPL